MVNIEQHRSKILAAHFATVMKTEPEPKEFGNFIHSYRGEYQSLKQWWDDMGALRVIRYAERQLKNESEETELGKLSMDADSVVLLGNKKIGKICKLPHQL